MMKQQSNQGIAHVIYYQNQFHGHFIPIHDTDTYNTVHDDTNAKKAYYFTGCKSIDPPHIHDCMSKEFYSECGFYDFILYKENESLKFQNVLYSGCDCINLTMDYSHICKSYHKNKSEFLFTTTAIITDEEKAEKHVEKYLGVPYDPNDMTVVLGVMEWTFDYNKDTI